MGWSGRAPARQRLKLARVANDKECTMSQTPKIVGIDIGKNSFHVVGHDERGAIVLRKKWSRGQLEALFANMPPRLIGMEACIGDANVTMTTCFNDRPASRLVERALRAEAFLLHLVAPVAPELTVRMLGIGY
jgi:hypothetical protein